MGRAEKGRKGRAREGTPNIFIAPLSSSFLEMCLLMNKAECLYAREYVCLFVCYRGKLGSFTVYSIYNT